MPSAYARTERERRFLCAAPPPTADVVRRRLIVDRYLDGTRLRLRRVEELDASGPPVHKLTQKLPGVPWGELTTIYVSEHEFALLSELPAATLVKERSVVPPLGYDVCSSALSTGSSSPRRCSPTTRRPPPTDRPWACARSRTTSDSPGGVLVRNGPRDILETAQEVLRGHGLHSDPRDD
ncbi:hypothetical protein Cch01nite_04950 [Cellulomonas chitinilytica]|uniref:Uncharacterized protein n=1 Tax=Cellulomonas chitinilytica TaxID=398759 RepID=A0A919P168_9CELL|nr:hypothetical protein [Cellulomonas chitinilytica]GIG19771.1 hypothetical protein Cch01nite_04950 [Cellulomonas chitinilytica]